MAARYELWLCNDQGTRVADRWGNTLLDRVQNLTATRIANDIGRLTMMVPPNFDQAQLRRDMIIQVWRAAEGASLELFRPYFLRGWELETKRGKTTLELQGRCPNDLLRRRVVRAAPGSPDARFERTEHTDDVMKYIVARSQTSGGGAYWPAPTYGTRAWANFSVEADTSAGPELGARMDFSYEYLLQSGGRGALQELAEASATEGDEVFFDVVPLLLAGKEMTFIFRTRVGQPGQDITGYGVLFSQDRGNLPEAKLTYDYTKEENMVWAINEKGPGDVSNNRVDMDASIWNRCEGSIDVKSKNNLAFLREKRGKIKFVGKVIDTSGMRFGVDWHFGDRIRARYQGFQFDTIVRAVTLQVDRNGKESVSARLEYQADACYGYRTL
jgi:hypothetical protein